MTRLLTIAAATLALMAPAVAHADTATLSYTAPVTSAGITCRNVSGTLHLKNSVGQILATITNHTHWCYHYANGLTQLPTGSTETGTGLGWDVDSKGYSRVWYTSTHGQAQTDSWAHFSLSVPILGHLQTWTPDICIVVGDKGNARNC